MKPLKTIAILIIVCMLLMCCACGEETVNDTPPIDPMDIYEAFLSGDVPARSASKIICFDNETEYFIADFCERFSEHIEETLIPVEAYDLGYAFIDCGNDSVPELALRMYIYSGEYADLIEDFIFKAYDDELKLVAAHESYYRSRSETNIYGYTMEEGSYSAFAYGCSYYVIDADGHEVFLFSASTENCHKEPYISYWDIPECIRPEDYPYDCFVESGEEEQNGSSTTRYNFTLPDYEAYDYVNDMEANIEMMDKYHANDFFTFTDNYDTYAEPSGKFKEIYDELGLAYYDHETVEKMIEKHCEELGADETIRNGEMIEWSDFNDKYTLSL